MGERRDRFGESRDLSAVAEGSESYGSGPHQTAVASPTVLVEIRGCYSAQVLCLIGSAEYGPGLSPHVVRVSRVPGKEVRPDLVQVTAAGSDHIENRDGHLRVVGPLPLRPLMSERTAADHGDLLIRVLGEELISGSERVAGRRSENRTYHPVERRVINAGHSPSPQPTMNSA